MAIPKVFESNSVLGAGPVPCRVMIIGEAPGADEVRVKKPFIGEAGKLLLKYLQKYVYISREEVYLTNAVKQCPPKGRRPKIHETLLFRSVLFREIRRVNPRVILTLGATALEAVLGRQLDYSLTVYRQKNLVLGKRKLISTYSPSAVLRSRMFEEPFIESLTKLEKACKSR